MGYCLIGIGGTESFVRGLEQATMRQKIFFRKDKQQTKREGK
uniref:Uncharacterized protein n=1 Tax=Musa acuminata subsp. malaccensis TaxID=214687 RepID=A0A804HN91_MUSAM